MIDVTSKDKALRDHLLFLLGEGGAHINFEHVIADFPSSAINRKIEGVPYTPWHLLEHMRIAQWDILEFCRNPQHQSPACPAGYWPATEATADVEVWRQSVESFRADLKAIMAIVADTTIDLFARIEHGDGQTMLREALLVADHNAYHLGVLSTLKRLFADR